MLSCPCELGREEQQGDECDSRSRTVANLLTAYAADDQMPSASRKGRQTNNRWGSKGVKERE
jgi:hypothetical protein